MNDLISRQTVIDKINERQRKLIYCFGFENDMVKIMDIAKSIVIAIPSAQPERKRGCWVGIDDEPCDVYECDQCGTTYDTIDNTWDLPYFCPNCGADMRTEETDCERAVEQLEHDILYEPTFNKDDGSM